MDRNEAIARIRAALKQRSGRSWSVTGGRGTAWGWIKITAPQKRLVGEFFPNRLTPEDARDLQWLLGLPEPFGNYVDVPASSAYYTEYVHRAEHGTPGAVIGKPYWD